MPQSLDPQLLLDPMQRHVEPSPGAIGHCRAFAKTINEAERTIEFVCSTGEIDRYGERVLPSAFKGSLDSFMLNPAFPFGHSYDLSPGGELPTVGHWKSVRVTDEALIGTAYFKPWGLGETCWRDYLEGNLTSVSVAFLTRTWEMRSEGEGDTQKRIRVFTDVDLLEISSVLIPANPSARIRAASAEAFNGQSKDLQAMIDSAVSRSITRHFQAHDSSHAGTAASLTSPIAGRGFGGSGFFAESYFSDEQDQRDLHDDQADSDELAERELIEIMRDALA